MYYSFDCSRPVIIEVPHFAALRGKEREIVILRSDNGETWREHTLEATEDAVQEVLQESFDADGTKYIFQILQCFAYYMYLGSFSLVFISVRSAVITLTTKPILYLAFSTIGQIDKFFLLFCNFLQWTTYLVTSYILLS